MARIILQLILRESDMANKQLEGQLFNHGGTNYLVVDDNDWESATLKV